MPEHLELPPAPIIPGSCSDDDHESLRILSRSPHPYHRINSELLEPSDCIAYRRDNQSDGIVKDPAAASSHSFLPFARDSPLASESGTEADDEHFLRGLPAPKARLHKGLRGSNEPLSGTSTPLLSPAVLEEEGRKKIPSVSYGGHEREKRCASERVRRRKELVRRATEVLLLVFQGGMAASRPDVRLFLRLYQKGNSAINRLFRLKPFQLQANPVL